jgi:hypothetical protein
LIYLIFSSSDQSVSLSVPVCFFNISFSESSRIFLSSSPVSSSLSRRHFFAAGALGLKTLDGAAPETSTFFCSINWSAPTAQGLCATYVQNLGIIYYVYGCYIEWVWLWGCRELGALYKCYKLLKDKKWQKTSEPSMVFTTIVIDIHIS